MAVKSKDLDLGDGRTVVLSGKERAYLARACVTLRQALIRARQKEISGSQVWEFRGAEIDDLTALLGRLS